MFCPSCGQQIGDGLKFCPSCGAQIGAPAQQAAPQPVVVNVVNTNTNTNTNNNSYSHVPERSSKSRWAAFFLCFFLGEFGVHRFYVGKTGTGLLWLFTFGMFGIGWLIDLISLLFGGFRDKQGLFLR